jgi:roadblock/LC7 domain-containing protein
MADLDKLMALSCATAPGDYATDGKLVTYKGDLAQEHAEMTALMCAANTLMGKMQAEGFTRYTGMNWRPFKGWTFSAGDYTGCVMGNIGVFVEAKKPTSMRSIRPWARKPASSD